jgi:hypothetical protein
MEFHDDVPDPPNFQRALLNLLRARYTDGGEPFAITEACILLGHQMRYVEDRKPPYKANRCFCGKVVEKVTV